MFKVIRIWWLRRALRRAYLAYHHSKDSLPCGAALAEVVSPTLMGHKQAVNRLLDELAKLDPSTPARRL